MRGNEGSKQKVQSGLQTMIAALFLAFFALFSSPIWAEGSGGSNAVNSIQMMESFKKQQGYQDDGVTPVDDKKRKLIMFLLGIPLIILVLATGAVGIGMGIYGKPWFIPHMILAGLSMTLALVHAVVGVAWFYPF
ncbi:MAG: hypothetical protein G3H99_03055 [Ferrovum sp.]|jgi:hypothetical protein|nr:hypothetical protein [Ferrovum sp.]NDU86888.1 hypothetical protein [Ferrovum sp.]